MRKFDENLMSNLTLVKIEFFVGSLFIRLLFNTVDVTLPVPHSIHPLSSTTPRRKVDRLCQARLYL